MANWKKVVVSGSDAALTQLNVDTAVTASYFKGDGSALTGVAATSLDIDNFGSDLTSALLVGSDKIIVSDNGTEGRTTISKLARPLQGNAITESAGTLNLNIDTDNFEISSNALAVKAGGIGGTDFADNVVSESAQIAADISGSLGANASLIRSLTAVGISGSLGANATLIRSLTAAGISGSLGANASLIRSLTASGISGSFTATSASFDTRIGDLEDGAYDLNIAADTGTAAVIEDSDTLTFTGGTNITTEVDTNELTFDLDDDISLTSVTASFQGDLDGNADSATSASYVDGVQGVSLLFNEVNQIANINTVTINNTQWGYVGAFDQGLTSTSNVSFAALTLSGGITVNSNKFTVASSTGNTSIAGTLNVTGNVTTTNNVTIGGDLTVSGTTVTVNTSNLEVEDRFIFLNEGSGSATPAGEGGIIVEGSTAGQGEAFYYDGNSSRWSVASAVSKTATSATPDAFAAIAHSGTTTEATTAGYDQIGNLTITSGGDIYIYA